MTNINPLLQQILLGDFGLLTMTPRYLFTVLFPVMVAIGMLQSFLPKIPFIKTHEDIFMSLSFIFTGLGCTTAALMYLTSIEDRRIKFYFTLLLILLIPCSAQLSMILTFASMSTLRVFLAFIFITTFIMVIIFLCLRKNFKQDLRTINIFVPRKIKHIMTDAFSFVISAALPFALGSILITLFTYFGLLEYISLKSEPFFMNFLGLPRDAANIFILNILKRDFGTASLLAFTKVFTADQLLQLLLMLTFFVPCFNTSVILIKEEKLPKAILIWLGSLMVSLIIGKLFRCVFSIFFV